MQQQKRTLQDCENELTTTKSQFVANSQPLKYAEIYVDSWHGAESKTSQLKMGTDMVEFEPNDGTKWGLQFLADADTQLAMTKMHMINSKLHPAANENNPPNYNVLGTHAANKEHDSKAEKPAKTKLKVLDKRSSKGVLSNYEAKKIQGGGVELQHKNTQSKHNLTKEKWDLERKIGLRYWTWVELRNNTDLFYNVDNALEKYKENTKNLNAWIVNRDNQFTGMKNQIDKVKEDLLTKSYVASKIVSRGYIDQVDVPNDNQVHDLATQETSQERSNLQEMGWVNIDMPVFNAKYKGKGIEEPFQKGMMEVEEKRDKYNFFDDLK